MQQSIPHFPVQRLVINTKADVKEMSMMEVTANMMGMTMEEMRSSMPFVDPMLFEENIITNKSQHCGAAAILGKMSELKKRYKNGFLVVPSSVHEMIVLPRFDMDLEKQKSELSKMVNIVNGECVEDADVLGHKIYVFA